MAAKHPVKVKRIADRRYRGYFTSESGRCIGVDLIAPAEYGVFVEGKQVARIVKTCNGWRVVQPTEASTFGRAVSPVGLDKFSRVKEWTLKNFTPPLHGRLKARPRSAKESTA